MTTPPLRGQAFWPKTKLEVLLLACDVYMLSLLLLSLICVHIYSLGYIYTVRPFPFALQLFGYNLCKHQVYEFISVSSRHATPHPFYISCFSPSILPPIGVSIRNYSGSALITPSNATNAIALAGKALKKQGKNPLQYPLGPFSL